MVDPIDGTSDFILGQEGFVVMIGLAVEGRPTVGAVAHPLSGKVYGGVVGAGAWGEAADGGRPPHCVVGIADAMGWELISQRAGAWTYAIRMLQEKIARLAPVLATGALRGTVHKR